MQRFERAAWWLAQGVALVPLQPKSKYIVAGYGPRRKTITSQDEARLWFEARAVNLGVVLGGEPGLCVADFDDREAFDRWLAGPGRDVHTLVEQTARGAHVFFTGAGLPADAGPDVEFKTAGVVMSAPSVHPSGLIYSILHEAPIAPLSLESARVLFPFLSPAPSSQPSSASRYPPQTLRRREAGQSLVERIKDARPVMAELEAAGVGEWRPGGKDTYVARCPFHADHAPSLWANAVTGAWGCNSPRCPAHDGHRAHDVINARAMRKQISVQAAIQELAREAL